VVKPLSVWAEVSCNGTKMGETPFRDVQMTVGSYDCKFSNPDQGTRTRRVEVKPGVPNIVVVQF
jgi:serine/threonine-protein kinase